MCYELDYRATLRRERPQTIERDYTRQCLIEITCHKEEQVTYVHQSLRRTTFKCQLGHMSHILITAFSINLKPNLNIILRKHHVSLLSQSFRSVSLDLHQSDQSFVIINLAGVSTKLYFNLIFTMQTYKELNLKPNRHFIFLIQEKLIKLKQFT